MPSVAKNVAAGAVQASLVTVVGYPFDTVKVRMQSHTYRNAFECVRHTLAVEGVRGLYRGGTMPWLSHLVKRPVQFPVCEYLKREQVVSNNYVIGGITGPFGSLFGTPLQVVKVGMQASSGTQFGTTHGFVRQHLEWHGWRGFYHGFSATLAKDCLFGASFVGHYYSLRDVWGHDRWYKNFASGATAHCATWALLMPIDYVKTTLQRTSRAATSRPPPSVRSVISNTLRSPRGPLEFWRGIGPACLRTIPVSGIAMTGYEFVRSKL